MKKMLWAVLLAVVFGCGVGLAFAEDKVVVLRSGEVLRGMVVKEGTDYKVTSEILGALTVREADVISIHEAGAVNQEWKRRQEVMMSDPKAMASIQDLAKNKEIVDLVMDPELQAAIQRQDMEALQKNPKFIQFAQNPEIQKLVQESMAKKEQ